MTSSIQKRLDFIESLLMEQSRLIRSMIATNHKQPLSIKEIAIIFNRDRSTIRSWINHAGLKPVGEHPSQGGHVSKYYILGDVIKVRANTSQKTVKG